MMCRLRGEIFRVWVALFGGSVGAGAMVDRGAGLRGLPHRGIRIGRGVYLGRGVVLDIPRTGQFIVGNRVLIAHYSVINATMRVEVGDDSQVAELCSIRDADHGIRVGIPIRDQALQSTPVLIGNDVWIGRGVAVLRGRVIEDGAIIGANSLVRGTVGAGEVAWGNPQMGRAWSGVRVGQDVKVRGGGV